MADSVCDIFDVFCEEKISAIASDWPDHIWVVACRHRDHTSNQELTWDRINHFVFAQPISGASEVGHCKSQSEFDALLIALTAEKGSGQDAILLSRYLELGFALQLTIADGDCAPDTVAIQESRNRSLHIWTAIRHEVSDSLKTLAAEPWFQSCFQCCQEWQPPVIEEIIDLEEGADQLVGAGKDDVGTGTLAAAESCPPGLLESVLASTSAVAAPSPLAPAVAAPSFLVGIAQPDETTPKLAESSPPPLPPPDDDSGDESEYADLVVPVESENIEPSDAVVLHWAMSRTSKGAEVLAISDCSADMANIIALEELIQIRRE